MLLMLSCSQSETKAPTEATAPVTSELASGKQPQVAVSPDGVARLVYGDGEKIYYTTSKDNGTTFSEPVLVDSLKGLYLGMSMGPQIASSAHYSVLTAIDKKGNIHSYRLDHATDTWKKTAGVNDVAGTVPEGLISIAADDQDNFYAVWLDVRDDKKNKIAFASTTGGSDTWSANRIVYVSPDKTVCECCKPDIEVKDNQVALMFRNWLNGSRDFYFTRSADKGENFTTPQKLGEGTWKLEGCPMDGGDLLLDNKNALHTVWQREGKIFYAQPGEKEKSLGEGRNVRIAGTTKPVMTWNNDSEVKLKYLNDDSVISVGQGSYAEPVELADKSKLIVWENEGKVYFRKI